jgi:hypothetical protein
MKSVRHGLVGLVCVPLVLLAACEDGDSKSDEPTPSASGAESASPSPSDSDSKSALPEDLPAAQVDPEEFVLAWVDALNSATLTGDTARVRSMSTAGCFTCDSFAKAIEDLKAKGGRVVTEGPPAEVRSSSTSSDSTNASTLVTTTVAINPGTNQPDAESSPVKFPAASENWDFYLKVVDGLWRVTDIGI